MTATVVVSAMTPFLVPLAAATLIVAVRTRVLIRRDRRCAQAYTGGPGEDQDGCAASSARSAPPRSR